ncbi:MAG: hypothetical protein U0744_10050 [Gemmataceae bacterium]
MPDKLRRHKDVLRLTREFFKRASWSRSSATAAGFRSFGENPEGKTNDRLARHQGRLGERRGDLHAEPVVVDGNLISSRTPKDLAPFGEAMAKFLSR